MEAGGSRQIKNILMVDEWLCMRKTVEEERKKEGVDRVGVFVQSKLFGEGFQSNNYLNEHHGRGKSPTFKAIAEVSTASSHQRESAWESGIAQGRCGIPPDV